MNERRCDTITNYSSLSQSPPVKYEGDEVPVLIESAIDKIAEGMEDKTNDAGWYRANLVRSVKWLEHRGLAVIWGRNSDVIEASAIVQGQIPILVSHPDSINSLSS